MPAPRTSTPLRDSSTAIFYGCERSSTICEISRGTAVAISERMEEMRSSDHSIPSIANVPRDKVRALGTGGQPTAMQDLTLAATALATEVDLRTGVGRLQRDAAKILKLRDAVCFWIDWPHRIAWTLDGRVSHELEETVIDAAGSGKRNVLAGAIIEPVGLVPARGVLALRKPSGVAFTPSELIVITTLATAIAPALDRLIATCRRRP